MNIDPAHFWIGETPMMPDNAYVTFLENVANHNQEYLAHLTSINMPWWFAVDNDCYDSQTIIQREMTALFAYHHRDHYPGIYRDYRASDKRDMEIRRNSQFNLFNPYLDQYWQDYQIPYMLSVLRAAKLNEEKTMLSSFEDDLHDLKIDFYRFTIENKGEWTKKVIDRAIHMLPSILRYGVGILHAYERLYGFRFELRHPIAFGLGVADRVLDQKMIQISFLESLMHPHSRHMLESLSRFKLFEEMPNYRSAFDYWNRLRATAIFSHSEMNQIQALTPIGLPAPLVQIPTISLPITTAITPTQSIHDQWQRIDFLSHAEVQAGAIKPDSSNPFIDPAILDLGWLIAATASILSVHHTATQGVRKINWLHSNINAALVDHTMRIAPVILKMAESAVLSL